MKPIPLPIAELKPALVGLGKIINRRNTLPVLGAVKIERNATGWITLTGCDLDYFATVRLEQPVPDEPATVLIPMEELVKITKTCEKTDTITVWSDEEPSEASGIISYSVAGQQVQQRCPSFAAEEYPPLPQIDTEAVTLPDTVRSSILEAFECASEDETRYILNGAYLDVSQKDGHYVVATDGRHLFSSNSFKIGLNESLVIPTHRFIGWKEFSNDGEWQLKVEQKPKDKDFAHFAISSRRWTFIGRQVEGNYPNWRQVIPSPSAYATRVEFENPKDVLQVIDRLPCHNDQTRIVGIELKNRKLALLGRAQGAEEWTRVEIPSAKLTGKDVVIALNREFLAKALKFGLTTMHVIDPLTAMTFTHEGRQMIVMPVRPQIDAGNQQPVSATPVETQPEKEEEMPRTTTTAAAPAIATNGNGNGSNGHNEEAQKPALELALDQIETIKGNYREAIRGLTGLVDTLKQAQRDQRNSEREVENVRSALGKLQQVRL